MATYTESAWGSTDATYPSSVLTKRWVTTNETTVAANSNTALTSDYGFEQEWSVSARRLNSLDAVDADANRDDSEVLLKFSINETALVDFPIGAVIRGSGSAGSETGYVAYVEEYNLNDPFVRIVKYVSGTATVLSSQTLGIVIPRGYWDGTGADNQYFMRFRVNGSTLQAKLWRESDTEPSAWQVEETDTSVTGNGWVGIWGAGANHNCETDWISVGTDGATAPYVADTTASTRITTSQAQTLYGEANPELRISTSQAQAMFKATNPELRISTSQVQVLYTKSLATPVDSDHVIPIEWRQGINSDQVILFEWNEDFFSDSGILFAWWTPLNIDHQSPVEWTLDVNQDHAIPVSWRQGIASDADIPVSWIQGIASDASSPIIYGGEASSDAAILFEWKTPLNIDREIPFGWSTGIVPHDSAIPFAWRSGVASDHNPIFSWKGEPQPPPDSVIPYAWRGPFAGEGADLGIVFDWTLELDDDSESPTEWTLSITEDYQVPYDWLTETGLVTLHQMPISWSSFIDIDEQIPISWSAELDVDHVIPYQWRLTIFLQIDNGIPISWTQDVNRDNSIPVLWGLELLIDHQIPFDWLAPALDSDQPIPIEYGTQLAVNTFTPVEWTLIVDQDGDLPVEWRVDVGSLHRIPITWASPAVATSDFVPVEWRQAIEVDHRLPYQWLTEQFLLSDHRMLVEYQQIFFKRFDQIIPWEAQGIGSRSFESPIEWRGDPNALQRIPIEWTDPLFALFVEDPKLCELWVADCNGIKWDAMRVAAAWKTDQLPDEPTVAPDPGLDWDAPSEEIGGSWFAVDCGTEWSAAKCDAVWLADEPQVWHADCLESAWAAQTQPDRWTAAGQETAWQVFEPNPR